MRWVRRGVGVLAAVGAVVGSGVLDGGPAAAAAAPRTAAAQAAAGCSGRGGDFPVRTRLLGGPADYRAGGEPRPWAIELRNTSGAGCRALHPLLVLVDETRRLRPGQVRLEFHDGERWRRAPVERTDQDETIAVLAGRGFDGFRLDARQRTRVRVRLAFAADARPDEVTAAATVVRRRGGDGDWLGQSGRYRFSVLAAEARRTEPPETPSDSDTSTPRRERELDPRRPGGGLDPGRPVRPEELARTGQGHPPTTAATGATGALLVLAGAALLRRSRRLRRSGPAAPAAR